MFPSGPVRASHTFLVRGRVHGAAPGDGGRLAALPAGLVGRHVSQNPGAQLGGGLSPHLCSGFAHAVSQSGCWGELPIGTASIVAVLEGTRGSGRWWVPCSHGAPWAQSIGPRPGSCSPWPWCLFRVSPPHVAPTSRHQPVYAPQRVRSLFKTVSSVLNGSERDRCFF